MGKALLWIIIVVLAVAAGFAWGWTAKPNHMDMMVLNGGKVYPYPKTGDTLSWIKPDLSGEAVQFVGPPSTADIAPCTDTNASTNCTIKKNRPLNKKLYLYRCGGCGDPGVPNQPSKQGGLRGLGTFTLINSFVGDVALASNQASGVWYEDGFQTAINVSTYPANSNKNDAIEWLPDPDTTNWSVTFPNANAQPCAGGPTFNSENDTCVVQSTATAQFYCVTYNGHTAGYAELDVNGQPPPNQTPPAACPTRPSPN